MKQVKALFVSHEHADHISGVPGIVKKFRMPVYITETTLRYANLPLDTGMVRSFNHGETGTIGALSVLPFRKSHDAADPHSFMVSNDGVKIGIITDIGYACKRVIHYFGQCHAAFLESNYCEDLLEKGSYPYPLKKRIRGNKGHLSNTQALELFLRYPSPQLQLLLLSHLSKKNNKPQIVERLFVPHTVSTQIFITSRHEASPVFEVKGNAAFSRKDARDTQKRKAIKADQLSLFE